jgi:1-acyl-sn-glycerol-3-phosphate acyltransferase
MHFLAKKELFKNSIMGNYLRKMNCIPLHRQGSDRRAIKAAFDVLRQGNPLMLFPEGTRSKDGRMHEAKDGLGLLALRGKAKIIPVYVGGTFKLLHRFLRKRVTVTFGHPIDISHFKSLGLSFKEMYRKIGEETMASIKELSNECYH